MDRSSLRQVITNDNEKRLAFKAKLAAKIDSVQEEAPAPIFNSIPVGSSVWHPDLGACTVFAVDVKNNNITLEFPTGKLDFVLNQTESKLVPVSKDAPAHIGPRTVQKPAKAAPVSNVKELSVALPSIFPTWRPLNQYAYLTTERHLTSEQANDVIDMVNGKPIRSKNTAYSVTWDDSVDDAKKFAVEQDLAHRREVAKIQPVVERSPVDTTPEVLGKLTKLSVTLPPSFNGWRTQDQFSFLAKTKRLTPEEVNDVMATFAGTATVMDDVQFEIVWDEEVGVTASGVERETAALVFEVEVPVTEALSIELPLIFKIWRPLEQFNYLTSTKHLTSFVANNVIATVNGSSEFGINLSWADVVPDVDHRASIKNALAKKVEAAMAVKATPAPAIPVEPAALRITEDVVEKKTVTRNKLSVTLPTLFQGWTAADQYTFLSKTKKLTPDESNNTIDVFNGKINPQIQIIWEDIDPRDFSDSGVARSTEEVEVVTKTAELRKVSVKMPTVFKDWNTTGQFVYLTRTKHLTTDEANDIMALSVGEPVHNNKINYEIIWSE